MEDYWGNGKKMIPDRSRLKLTWREKRKGKPRILEHGEWWTLVRSEDKTFFTERAGPWGMIRSEKTGNIRWIHLMDDVNFEIVEVVEP